ncbi:MAG: hypothetical protein JO295_11595 [Verrucomicrobia bacterium]|nr:hypothetical protein [Verrucomicrobiota bacterium]
MLRPFIFLIGWICCFGAILATRAQAQATAAASPAQGTTETPRPDGFWHCELPGGTYIVALRSIVALSSHEFIVDGAARVTEVNVATSSPVEVRFYYLEPITPNAGVSSTLDLLQEKVRQASQEATAHTGAEPVWQKVIKNYPTTTHAHTVEYRLASKDDLQRIFKSLEDCWKSGRGVNLKIE